MALDDKNTLDANECLYYKETILKSAGTRQSLSRSLLDNCTLMTAFRLVMIMLMKPVKRNRTFSSIIDNEVPTYTTPVTPSSRPDIGPSSPVLMFDDKPFNKVV